MQQSYIHAKHFVQHIASHQAHRPEPFDLEHPSAPSKSTYIVAHDALPLSLWRPRARVRRRARGASSEAAHAA
jgi:hypothetical protein